jgi:hypothetical protein
MSGIFDTFFNRQQRPRDYFQDVFSGFGMPFGRRQEFFMDNLIGSFPSMPTMFAAANANETFSGMTFEDLLNHLHVNDPNR